MRVVDAERIERYRNIYPLDKRWSGEILKELNKIKEDKGKYLEGWIMREVYERGQKSK